MASASTIYPVSPPGVPADLTAVPRRYRIKIIFVLAYVGLFVLGYLAALGAAGYLLYGSIRYFQHAQADENFWALAAIAGSAILSCWLVRPLFRGQALDRSLLLEIRPESQPELFAFIQRLCTEIAAPLPRRVFLSPDVNAAVVSSTALVNLVIPAREDLVIGLGLVNALNLVEFKAVLAHEFGHFSQKGIRLGPYVYVALRILADMVRGSEHVDLGVTALPRFRK
jgi:Zn-dependent protease with chaperone function